MAQASRVYIHLSQIASHLSNPKYHSPLFPKCLCLYAAQEVVSLGVENGSRALLEATGVHLTPEGFHQVLARAATQKGSGRRNSGGSPEGGLGGPGGVSSGVCGGVRGGVSGGVSGGVLEGGPGGLGSADEGSREGSSGAGSGVDGEEKEVVLLDTRNIYETRIGHFQAVSANFEVGCFIPSGYNIK